ncbi:hypothetical protein SNE40_016193 [Patella caerulea]|uniref:Transmembrane protein n=1 Tax=Patella caerulea TaxID=87958 RepID=A0AAN8J8A2_PATCE
MKTALILALFLFFNVLNFSAAVDCDAAGKQCLQAAMAGGENCDSVAKGKACLEMANCFSGNDKEEYEKYFDKLKCGGSMTVASVTLLSLTSLFMAVKSYF